MSLKLFSVLVLMIMFISIKTHRGDINFTSTVLKRRKCKEKRPLVSGGGKAFSVLALYFVDPSSNPAGQQL